MFEYRSPEFPPLAQAYLLLCLVQCIHFYQAVDITYSVILDVKKIIEKISSRQWKNLEYVFVYYHSNCNTPSIVSDDIQM